MKAMGVMEVFIIFELIRMASCRRRHRRLYNETARLQLEMITLFYTFPLESAHPPLANLHDVLRISSIDYVILYGMT